MFPHRSPPSWGNVSPCPRWGKPPALRGRAATGHRPHLRRPRARGWDDALLLGRNREAGPGARGATDGSGFPRWPLEGLAHPPPAPARRDLIRSRGPHTTAAEGPARAFQVHPHRILTTRGCDGCDCPYLPDSRRGPRWHVPAARRTAYGPMEGHTTQPWEIACAWKPGKTGSGWRPGFSPGFSNGANPVLLHPAVAPERPAWSVSWLATWPLSPHLTPVPPVGLSADVLDGEPCHPPPAPTLHQDQPSSCVRTKAPSPEGGV